MRDYIGIKNCNFATSLSGMYINGLPGIEFANIDGIANADQVSWAGVWSDIQDRAVITFREDVNNEFQKRYLLKQLVQTVDLGQQFSTSVLTPPGSTQNGILIETSYDYTNPVACSNLQKIFLQSVNFYFYDNLLYPSFTISVVDADLGTQLYTTTVSGVQGWNNVWLDQEFNVRRIFVFVSGNFTQLVQLDIGNFNLNNFGSGDPSGSWGWGNSGYTGGAIFDWGGGCGCQARINGVQYSGNLLTPLINTNTFGLSVVMSLKCGYDNIVCNNKKHFASSWQLCLGKELMDERIYSSRINRWTTIDAKKATDLKTLFEKQYHGFFNPETNETMAGKLEQAVRSVKLNPMDCCLEGNDHVISSESRL